MYKRGGENTSIEKRMSNNSVTMKRTNESENAKKRVKAATILQARQRGKINRKKAKKLEQKESAFYKINKTGKRVKRFKNEKFPKIPRKHQEGLMKIFTNYGYKFKPVPLDLYPKNQETGKITNFDPGNVLFANYIKIGMSGNKKYKNKPSYNLYTLYLNNNNKRIMNRQPSPGSKNPYSRLVFHIEDDSKFKNDLAKIKKGDNKKLEKLLHEKLIIETKENKAATKITAAIRGKMTRNKIKIINKLKNLGKNSNTIVKTKNNANLKIKYANKNKQTPINHNVNLNNNQVLITKGGLEAPGHSLSNKFKNHRSKYFKSIGKKGVWELKNKYKL